MSIAVEGKNYKVVESLPANSTGFPAKVVLVDGEEKVAVKRGGVWRFWTTQNRFGKE